MSARQKLFGITAAFGLILGSVVAVTQPAAALPNPPLVSLPRAACKPVPTAETVGRPAGLPEPRLVEGDIFTTADNQVIDNIRLRNGRIYVNHSGVTIKNSILEGDNYYAVHASANVRGLTVTDSEVHAGQVLANNSTLRRLHITSLPNKELPDGLISGVDGVTIDQVRVERLYVRPGSQIHLDGLQFTGAKNVTITDSYVDPTPVADGGVTAAVFFHRLNANSPRPANVTMRCNTLVKAPDTYYPLRLGDIEGRIEVRDTTFVGVKEGEVAVIGQNSTPSSVTWVNNKHADGRVVPEPKWG